MPGGPINTGTHPKLLWPGVHETWGQVYDEHPEEYPGLYEVLNTEQAYEQDVQITPFGLAPLKPEGQGVEYDYELQGPVTTYTPVSYGLGFIVTYEERINNLYPIVAKRRAQSNAFSMRQTTETAAAFIYNNAFVDTYFTTGDGVALCSDSHVFTPGGTWSNLLSPAADLSEAALEDATIQIMGYTDDRGNMINVMPRCLIVARQEWYNAHRILKSVLQADTANNNINVLKAVNAFPDGIIMNHYLTVAHAWFIRTNIPNGMRMFWRVKPDLEQDNDFDTKNAKAMSFMMCTFGCTDPRGIFGSNGP